MESVPISFSESPNLAKMPAAAAVGSGALINF
jgi:hypothetical protein